jgi:3-hydroxybutyryl-CoA dehydrogenase
MKLEEIHKISVLGAGIMGHGIAQSFIMGGYPVALYDIQDSVLKRAKTHIEKNLRLFAEFGLIKEDEIGPCLHRLSTTADLRDCVEESDFILEAAPEDLQLKQRLFGEVTSYCKKDAILASNTSSLRLTDIGTQAREKGRLVTTHWFNPPHIVPTVEVVKAEWTSEETFETAYALLLKIKKVPVRINKELPGFLINRIQMAMAREILDLYEKGVASAEDIDRAVRGSIGFRLASIGPLLTMDLGGLNLWFNVCKNLFPLINSSTEAPKALKQLTLQGLDGIKSGQGFYDYTRDFSQEELDKAVHERDKEFLNRLKKLYFE